MGTNGRGILYADIHSPQTALPSGWSTQDIGAPESSGAAGSPSSGVWELIGGGAGITGTSDQFCFAYTTLSGNGTITARVVDVPNASLANNNAMAGVMIRNNLSASSANVFMAMTPGSVNGADFQYRSTSGGNTSSVNATGVWNPYWVRLTRVSNVFTAYRSADGVSWNQVGTPQTIAMNASVYIGLAVTASDNNQLNISNFENVSVTTTTHIWDGGSLVNNLWSTPENWVDNVAPIAGDNLIFPAGAARLDNFNDFPSVIVFGSITVSGSGYHLKGNAQQALMFAVQSNNNVEVNAIHSNSLTISAGATVTIAPIAGGPLAANSALTPVSSDALQRIIKSGLEYFNATRTENSTSLPIVGAVRNDSPSLVEKLKKQPSSLGLPVNSQQVHFAALRTVTQNLRWIDDDADFDIAQHVRARKHSKHLEKAIDEVYANDENVILAIL